MAETVTQITQPPEFIEAAAKPFITQLQQVTGDLKEADLSQVYGPQFTAGLGALTQQAIGQAGGLGSYAPFLQQAGAQAAQAATQAAQAGQFVGPQAYQQFMSPYQQDIIDTTLSEFDRQAQRGITSIADQAIAAGAFGGGREGVQRAEYQALSDANRAALQAQLQQQGFQQAQSTAMQQFEAQRGLASLQPSLAQTQIQQLGAAGTAELAQQQAILDAQRQAAQIAYQEPLTRLGVYGSGLAGITGGIPTTVTYQAPGQTQPGALSQAVATAAGAYGLGSIFGLGQK